MTVDPDLVAAGNEAVAAGRADSLSGWVNAALVDRATRDRRLDALASAIAEYEAEFGEISKQEMVALQRTDRETAVVVRGRGPKSTGQPKSAGQSDKPGRGAA